MTSRADETTDTFRDANGLWEGHRIEDTEASSVVDHGLYGPSGTMLPALIGE